jgi:hypothetical protein
MATPRRPSSEAAAPGDAGRGALAASVSDASRVDDAAAVCAGGTEAGDSAAAGAGAGAGAAAGAGAGATAAGDAAGSAGDTAAAGAHGTAADGARHPAVADASDTAAAIAALRDRGRHQADPVRFHFIEALARRAEGQPAAVRRLLDARLGRALDDYLARYPDGHGNDAPHRAPQPRPAPAAGPLAELVQALARTPAVPVAAAAPRTGTGTGTGTDPRHPASRGQPTTAATPELQALDYFRHTWARLAVHRSLNQSRAKTPKNAGPLNSHRLVLRGLEVMREVSPAYLNRFVTYVDALLVLDGMGAATPAPPPAATPAAEGEKKRKGARSTGASGRG